MAQSTMHPEQDVPALAEEVEDVDQIAFPTLQKPEDAAEDSDAVPGAPAEPGDEDAEAQAEEKPAKRGLFRRKGKVTKTARATPKDTDEDEASAIALSKIKVGEDHARRKRKMPKNIRQVLGYKAMLPNGIAWLGADEWSATLRISDINYAAAAEETQTGIIDQWGKFINGFGGGTRLQVSVVNRVLADEDVASMVQKEKQGDELDRWRDEFNAIARQMIAGRSSNTVTTKYLTVTVREPDAEAATVTLQRVAAEAAATLRGMEDCEAKMLNRAERLKVLGHMTRPHVPIAFDEAAFTDQPEEGALLTHDVIAPWSISTATKHKNAPLVIEASGIDTFHRTLWVRDFPPYLSDHLISDLADIKADVTVSLHLEPHEQTEGTRLVNRQIAELEMEENEARRRGEKQRLSSEAAIPNQLKVALADARALRTELQQSNQKVLASVLLIGLSANSEAALDQAVKRAQTIIRKQSCIAEHTTWMQLDAFTTELPLGLRRVPLQRTLTTGAAAILVPFTTQEAFHPGGSLYGVNAASGNAVLINRTKGMNANGFILGSSGAGKGVAAKHEIMNVILSRPNDEIIIIDPEREYEPLADAVGGTVIRVDATSPVRLNPLEIDLRNDLDGDPITQKCVDVLDMLGSLIGGQAGLTDAQRGMLDRSLRSMYDRFADEGGDQPTLTDLRAELLTNTDNRTAATLADSLELYTVGSLNAFAHQTNVDITNRVTCWNISKLSSSLMTFGMMVILDQVWKRIAANRARGVRTWIWIDEFHMMFSDDYSMNYLLKVWKRVRKWGGVPTGITQNVEELRGNDAAALMLGNSDFLLLLRQHADDADALTDLLGLSEQQRAYFTHTSPGSGLIKAGNSIIPLDGRIPTDNALFKLYDTAFES